MGINGPQATACYGGFGTYVSRGENRVNDLECHANCLRERLDRLEAMLPTAIIEASIAIQKGERPPDLLELTQAEKPAEENRKIEVGAKTKHGDIRQGGNKRGGELPRMISGCGQAIDASNMIEDEDKPRVCMLQVLARKEKRLRKKIYEMELKEEQYKKALAEAGHTLSANGAAGSKNPAMICHSQCPGTKNQTLMATKLPSQNRYDDPMRQRINQLEASSKKISLNLKNLHRERAGLTCQAKNLTAELRCTQKCLGEVQQRVLGSSPSQRIPIMVDPSLTDICGKTMSCCAKAGNCVMKLPQNPEALRTLAGQFKEAYKNAENEGLSPSVREPIRKTAERLRALSNLDPNACPCGQPIKCDSCVICSCAEWERDLEGGGDEPLEDSSSESDKDHKEIVQKPRKERSDKCHCGCNDTSSESECHCGCSELHIETAEICPCSCGQRVESSAMSTSDPSTMTETTIPSSETDDSGYSQIGRGDACCHVCNLPSCASLCAICKNENPQKSEMNRIDLGEDQCELCKCETLNDSPNTEKLCKVCPCACTMCDMVNNQKGSPPCQLCRPIIKGIVARQDFVANPVECTCLFPGEVPPEIEKVCKVDKLREGLENLKNRNHVMRKILASCGCLSPAQDSSLSPSPEDKTVCDCPGARETHIKQTPSGLMCTVRQLQSKCRTKDGMIVALANELKKAATPEQTSRILECLADPSLCHGANDFDRSELWNYIKTSSGNKPRVSGRKTCHKDLWIGLTVLFLIIVSHVVRSYSIMPPFSEVVKSLKYWMDEIPGNVGYLINVLGNFARVLFQKQCFVSLLQFFLPFSKYLNSFKTFLWSLPGMQTVLTIVKITSLHVNSSCQSITALAQTLRNLQVKFCTQACRIMEYLNVLKRFILFQKIHLPSMKAAIKSSTSLVTSYFPMPPFPDFLRYISSSYLLSFAKIVISHVLCLWTFIVASPNHLRGVSSLLLYLFSCMIDVPAYVRIALEHGFNFILHLLARWRIPDRVLPFVTKFLSNVSTLIESCCCSGGNPSSKTGVAKSCTISLNPSNADHLTEKTCSSVSKNINSSAPSPVQDVENLTDCDFMSITNGRVSHLLLQPYHGDEVQFLDTNFEADGIGLRKIEHVPNDRVPDASQFVAS